MTFVLIVGLGIQGQKRRLILEKLKIKYLTIDPFNKSAEYKSIKEIPNLLLNKISHIFLCTPFTERLKYLKFFCKRNVKILIEKPLIHSEIEKKFYLINKNLLLNKIYCAYNHRFEDSIIKLRKFLYLNKIGKLYFCAMTYGNGTAKDVRKSKWKNKNKGVLMDLMPHLLDLSKYIFNKVPQSNGKGLKKKFENETTDYFEINTNINSLNISFNVSYLYWKNYFKIFVVGSNGYLKLEGLPKWGRAELIYGKRKLPSGKPYIKSYNFKEKDFTWSREIKNFIKKQFPRLDLKKEIEIYNFIKKC